MEDLFSGNQKDSSKAVQLCEVFLLYFDEKLGHIPLLISPDESLRENPEKMHLVKIHSIWFLDISDQASPDRMDLEYNGKMYFAKKFLIPSKRTKRRAGLEEDSYETIVLILALPIDMDIFGGALLIKMAERIKKHFNYKIHQLIEAEIAKLDVIKFPKKEELIQKGETLKKRIKALIYNTCSQYFQSVIRQTDSTTLKIQKAISYLSLKGVPISYIISKNKVLGFTNIKLFDSRDTSKYSFNRAKNFKILSININHETQEIEILFKNNTKNEFKNLSVKIISIQDYFEKEIFNQIIDFWLSEEELNFIFPIVPQINEYFLYIIDEVNKEKLFSKKIDIKLIDH
ncbi:MAG: hypothetical protein ACFFA6_03700 [Promethearchaeota archaeon]